MSQIVSNFKCQIIASVVVDSNDKGSTGSVGRWGDGEMGGWGYGESRRN
ncbi:hypothetical protein [Dapis sp. BLCC M229]